MGYETAAEIYQALRRRGLVYIRAVQANLISGARRRAKTDYLAVSQYRGSTKGMNRTRSYSPSLTKPGSDLLHPRRRQGLDLR